MIHSLDIQTDAMKRDLLPLPGYSYEKTQLYYLKRSDSATPMLSLRLHPCGMFTTRASDVTSFLTIPSDAKLYLEFVQDLPLSVNLPVTNFSEQRLLRSGARLLSKGINEDTILTYMAL